MGKATDLWLHLIVAVTIAVNVTVGVAFMGYMATTHTPIPDQFDRIITLMVGGLLGFLTKAGIDHYAEKVQVDQPPDEPVPVVGL